MYIYTYIYTIRIIRQRKKKFLYIQCRIVFLKRLEVLLLDVYVTFTRLFILEHRKKILSTMPNTGAPVKNFVNRFVNSVTLWILQ